MVARWSLSLQGNLVICQSMNFLAPRRDKRLRTLEHLFRSRYVSLLANR